jgi:hypothetical protein
MPNRTNRPTQLGFALALNLAFGADSVAHQHDGLSAYQSGEHAIAFQRFKTEAENGDTRSMYLLSTLYQLGEGTEPDEYKAFYWCKLAAEDGLLEAQYQLGMMYLQGEGVTPDDVEALRWLWEAADRGYPQATNTLEYVLYNDFTYGC